MQHDPFPAEAKLPRPASGCGFLVCVPSPTCPVQSAYTDTFHVLNTTALRRFGGKIYICFRPRHFTDKTYISQFALQGIKPRMTCTSLMPLSPQVCNYSQPHPDTAIQKMLISSGSTRPLLLSLFHGLEDNLFPLVPSSKPWASGSGSIHLCPTLTLDSFLKLQPKSVSLIWPGWESQEIRCNRC